MPATVLVGGQFGSEGKGKVAAFIAPEFAVAVRTGGANAGHTVVIRNRKFVFRHLPCAVVHRECLVAIGAGAIIDVQVLLKEIQEWALRPGRLMIDPQAVIVQSRHAMAELQIVERISSTGKGVGAALAEKVMRDAAVVLARDVDALKLWVQPVAPVLHDALRARRAVLLEGTQGTGLSLHHGAYPYVTSRDITAGTLCGEAGIGPTAVAEVILVVRTYPIRVGGPSGPLHDEIDWKTVTRESSSPEPIVEHTTVTGRPRRVGRFDMRAVQAAAQLNGATQIALTFVDYIEAGNRNIVEYERLSKSAREFVDAVEARTQLPVTLLSTGPDTSAMIDRRLKRT
jgi:adenylosuccinate synthase